MHAFEAHISRVPLMLSFPHVKHYHPSSSGVTFREKRTSKNNVTRHCVTVLLGTTRALCSWFKQKNISQNTPKLCFQDRAMTESVQHFLRAGGGGCMVIDVWFRDAVPSRVVQTYSRKAFFPRWPPSLTRLLSFRSSFDSKCWDGCFKTEIQAEQKWGAL